MTEGNAPKTSINKTYELDVDDIGSVPHCPEIQKQTDERYLYSAPYQTEPVYESPLCLELNANTTQRRESAEGKGRRSKRNDIYETTNDEALPNGRCYTGYSYVTNTGNVIPRFAYDNPVRATSGDVDHEYEESFRNSRFSKNVVYDDIDSPKTLTIQGIRDTKTGAPNRYSCGNGTRKQRANCVQIFTLLLSILACIIGILAFLVASGNVKLKDVENEPVNPPAQLKNGQPVVGGRDEQSVGDEREKLAELLANYATMKKQVESLKQNFTELMAKYNKQVESSKQNYDELMAKYNNMTAQFNTKLKSVTDLSQELRQEIEKNNSKLTTQFENVDSNILSLNNKLVKFSSELVDVANISQLLNNTLTSINSKFTAQLRNVSKQIGPRGFNGSQGLQGPHGPQGVGNMSACRVRERTHAGRIATTQVDIGQVEVEYKQPKGWKVMSAVCSTVQDAGALQTVLSRSGNTYTCTCVKPSIYSDFKALFTDSTRQSYSVKCKIIYWECPELT